MLQKLSAVHAVHAEQFEDSGARMAFPCFDEPRYKANFSLTLEVPSQYTALSNTQQTQRSATDPGSEPGMDTVTFATSPAMSTYLLAVAIGELHGHSALTAGGANVTVWSAPRRHPGLAYPLQVRAWSLGFRS